MYVSEILNPKITLFKNILSINMKNQTQNFLESWNLAKMDSKEENLY